VPLVGLLPALALLAGATLAIVAESIRVPEWVLVPLAAFGWLSWYVGLPRLTVLILAADFFGAAVVLGTHARERALHTPLRAVLDAEIGGFALDTSGPPARHDPVAIRAVLIEDASRGEDFTTLHVLVNAMRVRGEWRRSEGAVTLTVGGMAPAAQVREWRAGRTIETSTTLRRPARYLDEGVPDFERELALDGTTLFGSVKSGLLIDLRSRGSVVQERAAHIRLHVRGSIERWVAPHDPVSAAIVAAVLVGDRTGLPEDIRLRLQAAGTYHVIAISGGNIAILAALTLGVLLVCGVSGRPAALATLLLLVAYAQIVTTGASVWRATLMAVLYLGARLLDQRIPPWQAMAVAAAVVVCVRPLDVRDAGFLLTFGATAALLEAARRVPFTTSRGRMARWLIASVTASVAAEIALMPVSASTFSRVTCAGLVLNLAAVPLMGLVQIGGMVVALLDSVDPIAATGGWIAHVAASGLVGSARLVDAAPWLAVRVPPPSAILVVVYYLGLVGALATRGVLRGFALFVLALSAAAIVTGQPAGWLRADHGPPALRLTTFDVGQGESTLVQFPDRSTLLVDAAGTPFGGGFDVGSRVLAPALWARGLRSIDTLLLTHGDPDHIGGARAILGDFRPSRIWEGIPVAQHPGLQAVRERARELDTPIEQRRAGEEMHIGGARVRVLHPPPSEWERQRVRNDDSVVLEVLYGDVAVVLMGDIGAAVERAILPTLTPARVRILKAAHHGSRTSTSRELLEYWRPQIAIISCGRGNTFGHPAPDVLTRLTSIGAAIYRTDLDGQITLDTDGRRVRIHTYVGGQK
jgi:competence protein ComEC